MDFGIPTITVVGEGIADGRSEAHAWNYVYIDGKWYAWYDGTFLGKEEVMKEDCFVITSKGEERLRKNYAFILEE